MVIVILGSVMVLVNRQAPEPTHQRLETRCSRFCHDRYCPHFEAKTGKGHRLLRTLYKKNIALLKANGVGLTYEEANLLVYVVLAPMVLGLLFWLALRKR
ncbi:MAG: hypothetical protein AAGJ35_13105 [Myxococcota bacterium]